MSTQEELEFLKEFLFTNIGVHGENAFNKFLEYVNLLDNVSPECAAYIKDLYKREVNCGL